MIAFVPGRTRPQPRLTQKVKFLFSKTVAQWKIIDAENAVKAEKGLLNAKGKAYKPTRYAYRLERLEMLNEYRENLKEVVEKSCKGAIPTQFLFIFYLFHSPKTCTKKLAKAREWQFHELKPDYTNLLKGVEDALYESDSMCNAVAHYKLYVPREYQEGLLILHDEEIHKYVIETAIESFVKKMG